MEEGSSSFHFQCICASREGSFHASANVRSTERPVYVPVFVCVSRRGAANVWEVVGARSCVLFRSLCLLFLKPYITLDSYVTGAFDSHQKNMLLIGWRCISLTVLLCRFKLKIPTEGP